MATDPTDEETKRTSMMVFRDVRRRSIITADVPLGILRNSTYFEGGDPTDKFVYWMEENGEESGVQVVAELDPDGLYYEIIEP